MRQPRLMLLIVAVLTLGLISFAGAQMMMGGNHGQSVMNKTDSTSQAGMTGQGTMMNMGGMMGGGMMMNMGGQMGGMSQHWKMMTNNFNDLKSHFEKMMQMQDMKALKTEMQKHYDMMMKMGDNMNEQQSMCQNVMSMMQSGGMHGVMEADSTQSGSTGRYDHNH